MGLQSFAGWRRWSAAPLLFLALLVIACDKPSAAHTTSPSALALAGTATGDVTFAPAERPPDAPLVPDGWAFDVGNARFSALEDQAASIQVVTDMRAEAGTRFDVWLESGSTPLARWSAEPTTAYVGTLCFQLRLEAGDDALDLGQGPWAITLSFVDPATGESVATSVIPVHGTPPALDGSAPAPGSEVFRDLLGCPRSVI